MKNYMIVSVLAALTLTACGGSSSASENDVSNLTQAAPVDQPNITQPEIILVEQEPAIEQNPATTLSDQVIEKSNLSTGTVRAPVYHYYDIDTATSLNLTDEEAKNNTQWDIAFKRTRIILNSHSDNATALFFVDNTHEFYDEQTGEANNERFFNATKQSERALFDDINLSTINAPLIVDNAFNSAVFTGDKTEPAIKDFYTYNPVNHTVSANNALYFITRTPHALSKFNVIDMVQNGFGLDEMTLNVAIQGIDESVFGAPKNIMVNKTDCSNGSVHINFTAGMAVSYDTPWDISVPCKDGLLTLAIHVDAQTQVLNDPALTNTKGIDINTFAFLPWVNNTVTIAAYKAAGDQRSGLGWGEYNLGGNMLIWPNYATYVIRTSQAHHLFQVTDYYHSETQASGYFSVRHKLLDANTL